MILHVNYLHITYQLRWFTLDEGLLNCLGVGTKSPREANSMESCAFICKLQSKVFFNHSIDKGQWIWSNLTFGSVYLATKVLKYVYLYQVQGEVSFLSPLIKGTLGNGSWSENWFLGFIRKWLVTLEDTSVGFPPPWGLESNKEAARVARKKQQKNWQAPRIWAPKRSPTCGEMTLRSSAGLECLRTRVCSKHAFGLLFWGYFYPKLVFRRYDDY